MSLGIMYTSQLKFIEEYIPKKHLGITMAFMQIIWQLSSLFSILSMGLLPDDDDTEALKEN